MAEHDQAADQNGRRRGHGDDAQANPPRRAQFGSPQQLGKRRRQDAAAESRRQKAEDVPGGVEQVQVGTSAWAFASTADATAALRATPGRASERSIL